jgi:hypothetical protein
VSRFVDGHLSEGWQTHRVNDVLPLGSISNVHGIMSNGHHMYDAAGIGTISFVCVNRQTSEGTSYVSNLCQARRRAVRWWRHATRVI